MPKSSIYKISLKELNSRKEFSNNFKSLLLEKYEETYENLHIRRGEIHDYMWSQFGFHGKYGKQWQTFCNKQLCELGHPPKGRIINGVVSRTFLGLKPKNDELKQKPTEQDLAIEQLNIKLNRMIRLLYRTEEKVNILNSRINQLSSFI